MHQQGTDRNLADGLLTESQVKQPLKLKNQITQKQVSGNFPFRAIFKKLFQGGTQRSTVHPGWTRQQTEEC